MICGSWLGQPEVVRLGESIVVTSTQELERATYALITYYNYIKAYVICINRLYGSCDDGINAFITKVKCSTAFKRVQGGALASSELINAYSRGRLTLRAMQKLPIEEYPELALSANFWLPVQSYYAIHGVGLATMIALDRGSPKGHRSFCADFSELVDKYFPDPLCGRCVGGPGREDFSFHKLRTSIDKVTRQSQLANPEFVEDVEDIIGKSLLTTRTRILDFLFCNRRSEKKKAGKRNLSSEEKRSCCQKEHATSICDLMYRMRIRSNYDNPDMYLFAPDNAENASNHYRDLLYLTEILVAALDALIERRIGSREMVKLKSRFE